MRNRLRWLIAAVCLLPAWAAAQGREFEEDYEQGKKTWKEIEAQIPPYPKSENLILFETAPAGHRFYIDAPSVSIGDDGVVRYTLLVKTAGGAVNVSFEGMRCETREQKYYAIGHANGSWTRARDPQWHRIEAKEYNRQHGMLYAYYFCERGAPVKSARNAIDALKYGPTSPGFKLRE